MQRKAIFISKTCFILFSSLFLLQITHPNTDQVFGQENDTKEAISEISVHITEAIKSYAMAVGETYSEIEHKPIVVNTSAIARATGVGEGILVDTFSYSAAKNHLKTGELLFIDTIPMIKSSSFKDIIQVQSGMLMLQNLFESKTSYNIVKDVGFGMVLSYLDNIYNQQ